MRLLDPLFLWALAGISLPLWLHLTRRRKYKEMQVGTLRFLHEALRERRRRARFDDVPLLLLRLLAVALLALVFARPVWPHAAKPKSSVEETIVLLDASGGVTPKMAEAARSAADKATRSGNGGVATIAQFSDNAETIDYPAGYQPRPGAPANVQRALEWALDRLQTEGRASAKIVVIAHLTAAELPVKPPRVWPPQFEVEIVPLQPPGLDNGAVRQVTLLTPYVADEMELEARVTLPPGAKDRTVTLEAEGLKQSVVMPEGVDRVMFHFHPPRAEMRGWVSVAGNDAWPADDRRPFVVRWTEPRRVMLVDGRPGNTPFEGQAYFIRKALEASGAAHGKSPFHPEIVLALEGNQGPVDLSGVGAVALCGVPEITPPVARLLADFVHKGGGLIYVLDGHWLPESTASMAEQGLFPGSIAFTGETARRPLVSWDRNNPALQPFDGGDGGDLRDLEWTDGFNMRASDGWHSLADLDGGHSVLLEKEKTAPGEGAVLVCAHPLTREWTDIPREPLFVPLVKNLFAMIARLPAAASASEPAAPGLHEARAPGLYPRADDSTEVIAADAADSDVRPVDAGIFRKAFGLPETGVAQKAVAEHESAVTAGPPDRLQPGEWWPWLVLAICFLLILENLVATRPRGITSLPPPRTP